MPRFFVLFLFPLAITGCGISSKEDGAPPLTKEQQARWDKFKKEKVHPYMLAAYFPEKQEWKNLFYDSKMYTPRWVSKIDVWSEQEKGALNKYAKTLAADESIAAVVMLDLFTKDTPQVVMWYSRDGNDIRYSKKTPRNDLEDSLKEYLHNLQTTAE